MMSTPEPESRTSIWSVPERWRKLFFAIFSIQTAGIIGLAVWFEVFAKTEDSWLETIFAIGSDAAPAVAVIAAESIVVVDLVMILTLLYEDYRKKQYAKALAQGEAREREKWQAWNQRRLEAEANGQPFTEPPPSVTQAEEKANR